MSEADAQSEQAAAPARDAGAELDDIRVSLNEDEALAKLGEAARRGKLPEYRPGGPDGALFSASALGHPFDRDLLAFAKPDNNGIRFTFGLKWRVKAPIIYMAAMILTVEPGRYFLETMIPGSWGWGSIMWWYYPLTILPIPFAWLSFVRNSRRSTLETARESHAAVLTILGGERIG